MMVVADLRYRERERQTEHETLLSREDISAIRS